MPKAKTLEEIHEEAKERFAEIMEYEGNERDSMRDDKSFAIGEDNDQWLENDWKGRERDGRAFLTIMRSNQFTDHVKNQQRQNKPSIKISPTDEGAQEKAATLRQGLIRHIQYESKANQARQAGFDDAVDEGRGHWIVKIEDIDNTFNKKIAIEPIPDSRSVYMDIHRERPDYSDSEYGFVCKPIPREKFEEKYPDATVESFDKDRTDTWWTEKDVLIADYYCVKYTTRNLIEVELDGETRILWEDELEVEKDTLNITQERKVEDPSWHWYKMSGAEILDQEDLPWKEIPIITAIGKEDVVDGRWTCKGLIRDIKPLLRMYNFLTSNMADIIAKAPRAPWVGVEGQFEGHEEEYAASNTSDRPYLEYKDVPLRGGGVAPPPQRAQYSVDLRNLYEARQSIIEDIKAITGIYDASVGNRSNETSGVAIRAREAQGDTANFHFVDNYAMAINHEGRVINSALNVIYDTNRTITVKGDDDEEELVEINGENDEGLGEGNFNTTVSVGPSFNTQREEQAAGMLEMINNSAILQEIGMGPTIRAQDWNNKDKLADLADAFTVLKYPQLSDQLATDKAQDEIGLLKQQLQQAQQQMAQMQQQSQQLQEALQKADADKRATEAGKIQIELEKLKLEEQRVRQEGFKIKGELDVAQKKLNNENFKVDLESETQLKIEDDKNNVKLIELEVKNNTEVQKLKQLKEVPKPKELEKPVEKPVKLPDTTININGSKKTTSKAVKDKDGNWTVQTVKDD